MRSRLEELCHALKTGDFGLHTPRERSPSPPPVYDRSGKRYNTREQRARERAVKERADVVEKAKFISPIFIVWELCCVELCFFSFFFYSFVCSFVSFFVLSFFLFCFVVCLFILFFFFSFCLNNFK